MRSVSNGRTGGLGGGRRVLVSFGLSSQTVWAPVDKLLNFLMTLNVRKNEFQADRYATGLGYADGLQRGLIKITSENLGTLDPPPPTRLEAVTSSWLRRPILTCHTHTVRL